MSSWMLLLPWMQIFSVCDELKTNPDIIAAIIQVESSGRPDAYRPEKNYKLRIDTNTIKTHAQNLSHTPEAIIMGMTTAWGYMQIVGATAFDMGHRGLPTELLHPRVGIYWGVMYYKKQYQKYASIEDAVAAYNWGHVSKTPGGFYKNQKYVDKVMRYYRELTL